MSSRLSKVTWNFCYKTSFVVIKAVSKIVAHEYANYPSATLIFTIKKGNIVNTVNRVLDFVMDEGEDDFVDTFQHGSDDDDPQDSGDDDISSR